MTTTMSAAAAFARAASAKHSLPAEQRRDPGHSSAVTLRLAQALVEGLILVTSDTKLALYGVPVLLV